MPGIDRVNVSIDSLSRDSFFQITRRDALPQVLRGLEAIAAYPEVRPVKVNAVAIRDFTEDEVLSFAELARSTDYQVRFIEFMPLDADHAWEPDAVLTGAEIRALIERRYPLVEREREPSATARVYDFADGAGEIGFINPVSEPFCADCNRIRLTAEGKLRTCLFSVNETDLREPLRAGASDAELERDRPRRGLAQGAQASRRRARLRAAAALDERHRRLAAASSDAAPERTRCRRRRPPTLRLAARTRGLCGSATPRPLARTPRLGRRTPRGWLAVGVALPMRCLGRWLSRMQLI